MTRKIITALSAVMAMTMATPVFADDSAPVRYEAEDAVVDAAATPVVALATASGGSYVEMREGNLNFAVNAPSAGFYTIWARYSQTCDDTKNQYLFVNGADAGRISFPITGPYLSSTTCGPAVFETAKIIGKVNFKAGANTVEIRKEWGWVNIDYIEVGPFVSEPFVLDRELVTAKHGVTPSVNAGKVYQFMRENFQKKIISGIMAGYALTRQDGSGNPHTLATLPETKHVFDNSGKYPALLGLDFFHGTGFNASDMWFAGENSSALALAEELFGKGGIPHLMWHWKDPNKSGPHSKGGADRLFYTDGTDFDLSKAFTNTSHTAWNTGSDEYKNILADIDTVSGYLKKLADKNVAVLWRPLHEAAGGWFWWGAAGRDATTAAQKARANKELWILMFDRMVKHHGLDNLIWVWTCEESGPPLEWYPGDEYVDIVGRDYYYWPDAQNKQEYGSLVSNFENLKSIYGAKKMIALSEQGTVPDPDSLVADGAGWSFFMSWNEAFLRTANPNAHWQRVMNHNYVITLDKMPGWSNYVTSARHSKAPQNMAVPSFKARAIRGALELSVKGANAQKVELFNLRGARIAVLNKEKLGEGTHRLPLKKTARQMSFVKITTADKRVVTVPVQIGF